MRRPIRDVAIAFGGGGNRALYQLGLLRRWKSQLSERIGAVASCSAGACVATIWFSGRASETYRYWQQRSRGIARNFDWARLVRGHRPTPHSSLYRDLLLHAYAEGGFERIRSAPFPILVLMTRPPRDLPAIVSVPLGIGALVIEHLVRRSVIHTESTRRLGFTAHVVDARRCRGPRELADLVAASSAIPPFIPTGWVDGKPMLDGGLLDNAPAATAEQIGGIRRTLVMLSQPYPESRIGEQGSRLYVAPTTNPPVGVFDCTRPDQLEQTIAMGEADAEHHGRRLHRFLHH